MNVPKLRFPNFEEKWETLKLGEVTEKIGSGKTPKGGKETYQTKGIALIRSQNIFDNQVNYNDIAYISSETNKNMENSQVYNGDVLLNITGASIGRSAVYKNNLSANVNQHVCIIRPKKDFSSDFIQLNISSNKGQKEIEINQAGGGREGLNFQQIAKMTFSYPNIEEQKKISNFFELLNNKIQLQQEKIDLLKEQKKGILQKIFTRELRFKGENGQEFPEWELTSIKEIATSISYGMNAAAKPFDNKNIYIRITDIDDESRKFLEHNKVSPDGTLDDKFLLDNGDILFARTGASVGKSYYYEYDNRPFYFAGFLIRVRLSKNINSHFIYQQTLTTMYSKWVQVMSMRSGQPGINAEEYGQFEILLPCKKEQDKISSFLYSLDKKIESMNKYKYELEIQKQAFMQQLFI